MGFDKELSTIDFSFYFNPLTCAIDEIDESDVEEINLANKQMVVEFFLG